MKKCFYFLLFLVSFSIPISVYSETEIRLRHLENRLNQLESCCGIYDDETCPNIDQAAPRICYGRDLYLTFDFLYWTARLDTLTYCRTGQGNLINLSPTEKGQSYFVDWNWDPGFKVGLGWNFDHGGWDMHLTYSWFYNNVGDSKSSSNLSPSFSILTPFIQSIADFYIDKAHAHWDLHYQVGDLDLGHAYSINKYLHLRPFIGIKGTFQKQSYNVFFETIPVTIANQDLNLVFQSRNKHSYWGIGMQAGLSSAWHFTPSFSLYGNFALSGIWSHYNISRKDVFESINQSSVADFTHFHNHAVLHLIKPVFEYAIGLRLESYLFQRAFYVRLQAGWESHIWLNQTLYINIQEQFDRFDLSLQGLTARLRIDF